MPFIFLVGLATCAALQPLASAGATAHETGYSTIQHMSTAGRALKPTQVRGPLSPAMGSSTARVTIVVFSDYHCPYCRELSGNLEQVLTRYPTQVRIVYRHFATSAATEVLSQASLCASDQGKFPEYHRLVFATPAAGPQDISELADAAGLEPAAFQRCIDSARFAPRVRADIAEGERLNIQVTPTVFVNGVRKSGLLSVAQLGAMIESML